ncbi:coiled-coil domain-containing protein 38 [Grammomys surdaster]|uniref:coiled-coil domain-containing protein 38 n=1 Tax=Grammomys surdaster TaxID=491861 RepID=UPI00109FC607|nr:coiled-coil domain-containing protein 38 [Grammomys surdaster]
MTSQLHTSRSSGEEGKDAALKKEKPYKIFFKDLFLFKENEIAARKRERMKNHSMKIYQKTTFSSRMKSRSHLGQLAFFAEAGGGSYERLGLDPTLILRLTEGADRKRTVHEFINDQRDRFLLEYAVSTKKNTIKRFERLIATKESQLRKAEKKLQDDVLSFEEFLRENDQRSVDALKIKRWENKLLKSQTLALSDGSRVAFMVPGWSPQWRESHRPWVCFSSLYGDSHLLEQKRLTIRHEPTWKSIYFAEKFIEFLLTNIRQPVAKKDGTFHLPKYIIYQLKRLQNQVKHRSVEEKLIDSLSRKINQVYRVCIGDAEVGSLNAVQKLVKVESRLVELSDLIESIPKESVEAIERIKQKERRQKLREEKMKEKQRHQEERLKAALERAVAQPKKKLGRRLIYRSKPQSASKHELLLVGDTRSKSQEEEYFFS